jgi:hypothetical protein
VESIFHWYLEWRKNTKWLLAGFVDVLRDRSIGNEDLTRLLKTKNYAGLRRSRELHSGGEHLGVVACTGSSVSAACVSVVGPLLAMRALPLRCAASAVLAICTGYA